MTFPKKIADDWFDYQEQVAKHFRSLGMFAKTNALIDGARGKHKVDVLVKLKLYGINAAWICECKYWKSAIPKEKVLAFQQIVADLGADRGFLFSESGFQAGAIQVSKKSNITLTSFDEIKQSTEEEIESQKIRVIAKQISSRGCNINCVKVQE